MHMRATVVGLAVLAGVVAVVGVGLAKPEGSAVALLESAQQIRRDADQQLLMREAACRQKAASELCRAAARQEWLAALDRAQQVELTARQQLGGKTRK